MRRVVVWLSDLDLRRVAAVLFTALALVGTMGLVALWLDPGNEWIDLDSEVGLGWPPSRITLAVPAIWSGLTLMFAGGVWLAVGWSRPLDGTRTAALGLGLLLLGFAIDEVFKVHERLEGRTGLDWQLIYLPVAVVAAMILATLTWRLRRLGRGIPLMLLGGVVCWAVAAALEYMQWNGDEKVELYDILMVPEELLELAGTALFALAALATLKAVVAERPAESFPVAHASDRPAALAQLRALVPLVLSVAVLSASFVAASLLIAGSADESIADLFADMYELTGSRLTGLLSIVGVLLLVATSAICLFASFITTKQPGSHDWARFLLGAGLLAALLAVDDYLSIHEFADDVLAMATGIEADRLLKNVLEAGVLGLYGFLLVFLLWRYRELLSASEWVLLAIGVALLGASLALDLAPHTWLEGTFGISLEAQGVVEDTLKLAGLGFVATYFVRTSAKVVRGIRG